MRNSKRKQRKPRRSSRKITSVLVLCIIVAATATVMFSASDSEPANDSGKKKDSQVLNHFYLEEENSLDGVYIGSSGAYRYWNPVRAFNETGMAVYCYASESMPFAAVEYVMRDVVKTQDPEFIIVEMRNITRIAENTETEFISDLTDYMPDSQNRKNAINDLTEFAIDAGADINEDKSYYTNRGDAESDEGEEREAREDAEERGKYKGFPLSESSFVTMPITPTDFTAEQWDLESCYVNIMRDLLDYCDTLDCDVIFVAGTHVAGENRQGEINSALAMAEDRGYMTLNFNSLESAEEIGLDWQEDFYNHRHVNVKGALKYTDYLAELLSGEYDIDDHRGDGDYKSWEEGYDEFYKEYKEGIDDMEYQEEDRPKELSPT